MRERDRERKKKDRVYGGERETDVDKEREKECMRQTDGKKTETQERGEIDTYNTCVCARARVSESSCSHLVLLEPSFALLKPTRPLTALGLCTNKRKKKKKQPVN